MPHLEEQFPPVNPLVLQRPDALDPPDREEDEEARPIENRAEDETPIPGSLANGIDRVTLSANARVIVPVQPNEETVPLPADLTPGESEVNPVVPELLDIETQDRDIGAEAPEVDEIIGASLQNFLNILETRRRTEASSTRTGLNPIESRPAPTATPPTASPSSSPTAPGPTPVTPLVQNAVRETREESASRIENQLADEPPPATNAEPELDEESAPRDESRFVPVAPPPRGPLSAGSDDRVVPEPAEDAPAENTLGIRGNTPVPRTEGRVNILTPPNVGEEPPGINIQETRNVGQGRALSLDLATTGNDDTFIAIDTIDEALEEAGAIVGPDAPEPQAEILLPPVALTGVNAPLVTVETAAEPQDTNFSPIATGAAVSSPLDSRQVFEQDQENRVLQLPTFPELDPDEPFVPNLEPEAQAENIPFVVQGPLNVLPPTVESAVAVVPAAPGNVVALREKSRKNDQIKICLDTAKGRGVPAWLELAAEQFQGSVRQLPERDEILMPIQEQLIVELYSK